jgi:hypothetical protein
MMKQDRRTVEARWKRGEWTDEDKGRCKSDERMISGLRAGAEWMDADGGANRMRLVAWWDAMTRWL